MSQQYIRLIDGKLMNSLVADESLEPIKLNDDKIKEALNQNLIEPRDLENYTKVTDEIDSIIAEIDKGNLDRKISNKLIVSTQFQNRFNQAMNVQLGRVASNFTSLSTKIRAYSTRVNTAFGFEKNVSLNDANFDFKSRINNVINQLEESIVALNTGDSELIISELNTQKIMNDLDSALQNKPTTITSSNITALQNSFITDSQELIQLDNTLKADMGEIASAQLPSIDGNIYIAKQLETDNSELDAYLKNFIATKLNIG